MSLSVLVFFYNKQNDTKIGFTCRYDVDFLSNPLRSNTLNTKNTIANYTIVISHGNVYLS